MCVYSLRQAIWKLDLHLCLGVRIMDKYWKHHQVVWEVVTISMMLFVCVFQTTNSSGACDGANIEPKTEQIYKNITDHVSLECQFSNNNSSCHLSWFDWNRNETVKNSTSE